MSAVFARAPLSAPEGNNTAHLPADALHGLLVDLERTVSDDPLMPMLNGIVLHTEKPEAGDNRLYGTSTDRHAMGQAFELCAGALPGVYLDTEAISVAKPFLADAGDRIVYVHLDEAHHLTLHVDYLGRLTLFTDRPTLPDLASLVVAVAPTANSGAAHLAAKYLRHFAEIGERRGYMVSFTFGEPEKPTAVDIGPGYRALIMPMKQEGSLPAFRHHFPEDPSA